MTTAIRKWKQVLGNHWKPQNEDESIEGVLLKKAPNTFDSFDYHISVGPDDVRILRGTTMLDGLMNELDVGAKLKIVYKGEQNTGKGNPAKIWEVFIEEILESEGEKS